MKKLFTLILCAFFIFSLEAQSHISTQSHQGQVTQIAPVSTRGTDGTYYLTTVLLMTALLLNGLLMDRENIISFLMLQLN